MPLALSNQHKDIVAYSVKPGDTLTAIINRYYGQVSLARRQEIVRAIEIANDCPKIELSDRRHKRRGYLMRYQHRRIPHVRCPAGQTRAVIKLARARHFTTT
jgi:hypothetical protein